MSLWCIVDWSGQYKMFLFLPCIIKCTQNVCITEHYKMFLFTTYKCNTFVFQDKGEDYQCECPQGFHGQHCESSATSCEELPCQNGASCVSFYDSYQCRCLAGYMGVNCEREVDECSSNPCRNGTFRAVLNPYTYCPLHIELEPNFVVKS